MNFKFFKNSIINIGKKLTKVILNIQLYIPIEPTLIMIGIIDAEFNIIRSKKLNCLIDILLYES